MSLSKDVLAYVPVKLIPAITGLLSIVILTRNLSPEAYGRYSVAITTALLLVQLAGSWLSNSVLYLYPEYLDAKSQSEFRRQTINFQLIVATPASLFAYLIIYLVTDTHQLALIGGLLVLGQLMQGLLMSFLQSSRKIHIQAVSVAVQSIFQIGTLCLLIFAANGKETAAVIAMAIGFFAGNVHIFLANRKSHIQVFGSKDFISRELLLKLLGYGLPMCLWFFATQFYMVGDRIILQFFGVKEQLGQYAAFRDLATGCAGFLTMPLLMASHPIIMAKWKNKCDPQDIQEILSNNIIYLALIFTPLIAMTDIIGHDLIESLFGSRYLLPASIMILIIISIFTGSVAIHLQKGLEVAGKTVLMAKISLSTAIFSGVANSIVIPIFGVLGGAVIVVLSSVIYLLSVFIAVQKTLRPKIDSKFWFKIIFWLLLVKLLSILISQNLQKYFSTNIVFASNIFIIALATLILFLTDYRVRQLVTNITKRSTAR